MFSQKFVKTILERENCPIHVYARPSQPATINCIERKIFLFAEVEGGGGGLEDGVKIIFDWEKLICSLPNIYTRLCQAAGNAEGSTINCKKIKVVTNTHLWCSRCGFGWLGVVGWKGGAQMVFSGEGDGHFGVWEVLHCLWQDVRLWCQLKKLHFEGTWKRNWWYIR